MRPSWFSPPAACELAGDRLQSVLRCAKYLYGEALCHSAYIAAHMICIAAEVVNEEWERVRQRDNESPDQPSDPECIGVAGRDVRNDGSGPDDDLSVLIDCLEELRNESNALQLRLAAHFFGAAAECVQAKIDYDR